MSKSTNGDWVPFQRSRKLVMFDELIARLELACDKLDRMQAVLVAVRWGQWFARLF